MKHKLWGGRFVKKIDPQFEKFSASLLWDRRLLSYDLKIDAAHVAALKKCGVLSQVEAKKLISLLTALAKKQDSGAWTLNPSFEDVHSAVHAEVKRLAGPLADKLHTARSRNDLVSQSTRLYCKDQAAQLAAALKNLQKALVEQAQKNVAVFVPGMTHLQNAQVLSQAHIFLSYVEMLERSIARFDKAKALADVCVLGSGALAGVTFSLDQSAMAKTLGLSRITDNSYDVSGDRDFILDLLYAIHVLGLQLSRVAEDLMIGQLKNISLIDVDQAFCTGSSMMPQKKNADFLELTRGCSGVFMANLTGLSTTLKGLPTSYNRDLQWDKRYLFDSVETCESLVEIFTKMIRTLSVKESKAKESLSDESLYATDLADYLVRKGLPFGQAHQIVGEIVAFSENQKVAISKIGLDLLKRFAPQIGGDIYDLLDARHSVYLKKTRGSTHPEEIQKQIRSWKRKLGK